MNETLRNRRQRAATAWSLSDEIVLIAAGEPLSIPGGADQTYPFRVHPEYRWLTERSEPGGILAFDPATGWEDLVPEVTESQIVWEGRSDHGAPSTALLAPWLSQRRGRSIVNLGCPLVGVRSDPLRVGLLRAQLTHARRPKDAEEIDRIRRAVAATAAGFAAAERLIRPGVTERFLQIEIEAEFFRHGGQNTAYDSIVGGGPNSVVFHFSPSPRAVETGEMVLIDAGTERDGYCADVTRTFASDGTRGFAKTGGRLAKAQQEIYDIVLRAQIEAVNRCRLGVEWTDVHLGAARTMADGLSQMGLLRGRAEDLVEREVHTLFFPHGIGHMVGLGVRDASGVLPGRTKNPRPSLATLRMDLPLEPGYVVTVEPGLYFIPALLQDKRRRQRFAHEVDWRRVDELIGLGGVRIEDNVLVTTAEPENLTAAIPK